MSIDERLERLLSATELHNQQIGANTQQLAELRDLFHQQNVAHNQQIGANTQQLAELRDLFHQQNATYNQQISELRDLFRQQNTAHNQQISELREANMLLVQIVSRHQDDLQEYKKTTNAALDRIDRTLTLLFEQRNNGHAN